MDALWMIIVIVVIVAQVVSKLSGLKGKLPGQWETRMPRQWKNVEGPGQWNTGGFPQVFKDMGFPWEEDVPKREAYPEDKSEPMEQAEPAVEDVNMRESMMPERVPRQRDDVPVSGSEYDDNGAAERVFSTADVMNGLIFSELLQPPKSKRKR